MALHLPLADVGNRKDGIEMWPGMSPAVIDDVILSDRLVVG